MIEKALRYLVGLKDNKTYELHGDVYSDHELVRIPPHINRPKTITVGSLDGLVKLAAHELDMVTASPLFIQVESPTQVRAFSSMDPEEMGRDLYYSVICPDAGLKLGWRGHEEAIIELRSRFIPNEDTEYLLELLSRMCVENGVANVDNGVTQIVTARQGVSLKENVEVRPIVSLCPFRTFREVMQPESDFLLRVNEQGHIGLFEADGGIWKIEAKENIAKYISEELDEYVKAGRIVVMI